MSDRSVRNYCAHGRIPGAFLTGKTWNIPADALKPEREKLKPFSNNPLLKFLLFQWGHMPNVTGWRIYMVNYWISVGY